ncbi:response regulator [Desulfobacula toluolica]|uniref:Predicted response regulator n=1 Tax=Desulfobacula toluolica (strain DSM 7467 / Tol2) TaxID=651182 RepID=K0NCF3_DESTT|nr:response regulator [Desulfobacula toluolica]CCK82154.1 predicted response regulator [Desulfobacula toluolica Tol2]
MEDEEKTKKDLISELNALRKEYTQLKASLSKNQESQNFSGTETILIVDDNKQTRETIRAMLEKCGYNIIDADSSLKAIEIFKSCDKPVHLVLADVVMPEINGPEMVKKLLDMQSDIPVVFMSGYAAGDIIHDDVFKVLCSKAPFIEKPFTFAEICLVIRQQLDKKI